MNSSFSHILNIVKAAGNDLGQPYIAKNDDGVIGQARLHVLNFQMDNTSFILKYQAEVKSNIMHIQPFQFSLDNVLKIQTGLIQNSFFKSLIIFILWLYSYLNSLNIIYWSHIQLCSIPLSMFIQSLNTLFFAHSTTHYQNRKLEQAKFIKKY